MSINDAEFGSTAGTSRRTVIKTAAWSVPVIAAAIATPLSAASGNTPDPAPGGGLSVWQGGTSVDTWTIVAPFRVQINTGQSVGYNVYNDQGGFAAAGEYNGSPVTVEIEWGAGSGVPVPSSYTLVEQNLNGWTRVGSLPAAGETGSVSYIYTGILNGAANVVPLPVVWLVPTGGGALTPSYVNTKLYSDFLSEKTSGAKVP